MKTALIAIVFFLLGLAVFFGYNQYSDLQKQNQQLQQENQELGQKPSIAQPANPTAKLVATTKPSNKSIIKGELSYPSEMIPELIVYAFEADDYNEYFWVETETNQSDFELEVPPGTYHLIAYLPDETSDFGGGYTKAVPCGLSVECTNHEFIPVKVKEGETVSDIQLSDWYAPEDTFPLKP